MTSSYISGCPLLFANALRDAVRDNSVLSLFKYCNLDDNGGGATPFTTGRTRYPHPISVLPWRLRSTIPFLLTCAYTPKLDDVMLFLVQQNRPPEDDEDEDGFIKTDPEDMFHVHHGHRVQHKPSAFNAKPKLMHSEVRAQKPAKKGSAFRCVRNASHARKRHVLLPSALQISARAGFRIHIILDIFYNTDRNITRARVYRNCRLAIPFSVLLL